LGGSAKPAESGLKNKFCNLGLTRLRTKGGTPFLRE
jgi:hypothetical protein